MRDHDSPTAANAPSAAHPVERADLNDRRPGSALAGTSLADRWVFLKGFLKQPNGVASVIPSSMWLEQRIMRNARPQEARCVVELGPGTGGTTRALLRLMSPQAKLLAIELNPDFHAHVRRVVTDPRLQVECGSAERLAEFLAARRLPAPDVVISGIPFSTMPHEVGDRIAAAVASSLAPGGRFVAYQWAPAVAERTTPHMGPPRREFEPLNIPPMRVYTWVKPAR